MAQNEYLFITILNDRPEIYQRRLIDECLKNSYPGQFQIIDSRMIRVNQKNPDDNNEINILKSLIDAHAQSSIPRYLKFIVTYC